MRTRFSLSLVAVFLVAACSAERSSGEPLSGEALAEDLGCRACHTDADTDLAPTWIGLWGTEVPLEDGSTVVADEAYVRKSIEEPSSDIVAGYGASMPVIEMTEQEKVTLVEYIESLG